MRSRGSEKQEDRAWAGGFGNATTCPWSARTNVSLGRCLADAGLRMMTCIMERSGDTSRDSKKVSGGRGCPLCLLMAVLPASMAARDAVGTRSAERARWHVVHTTAHEATAACCVSARVAGSIAAGSARQRSTYPSCRRQAWGRPDRRSCSRSVKSSVAAMGSGVPAGMAECMRRTVAHVPSAKVPLNLGNGGGGWEGCCCCCCCCRRCCWTGEWRLAACDVRHV